MADKVGKEILWLVAVFWYYLCKQLVKQSHLIQIIPEHTYVLYTVE